MTQHMVDENIQFLLEMEIVPDTMYVKLMSGTPPYNQPCMIVKTYHDDKHNDICNQFQMSITEWKALLSMSDVLNIAVELLK